MACSLLALLCLACSKDDAVDNRDLDYGYAQFKLYKEASVDSRAVVSQLDYLAKAAKVTVRLNYGEALIVQTLNLSAPAVQSPEFGLRSDKIKLLAGD